MNGRETRTLGGPKAPDSPRGVVARSLAVWLVRQRRRKLRGQRSTFAGDRKRPDMGIIGDDGGEEKKNTHS